MRDVWPTVAEFVHHVGERLPWRHMIVGARPGPPVGRQSGGLRRGHRFVSSYAGPIGVSDHKTAHNFLGH
jgi:hypothetical protein